MARTINFVRDRRQTISRQVKQDQAILRYVTYALIGIGLVLLAVLSVRFFLIFRIKMIQDKQAETKQAIMEKEELEKEYTIFAHKLKAITDLFGKRREKQEALAFFSGLFEPGVVISQLSYTAGEEILSFTIDSPSIFALEKVFDTMNSTEVEEKYPQIMKNSLSRGANGHYGMSITLPLGDSPLDSLDEEEIELTDDDGTGIEGTEADGMGDDTGEPVVEDESGDI